MKQYGEGVRLFVLNDQIERVNHLITETYLKSTI